jgi:hypothetical protein
MSVSGKLNLEGGGEVGANTHAYMYSSIIYLEYIYRLLAKMHYSLQAVEA